MFKMAKELGKEIFINQSKALAARNYKEILKKIKVPSLQFVEDMIGYVLSKFIEKWRVYKIFHFRNLPDAAHLPTLEQPSYLNKILKEWLLQ